ncbi:MAG: hypothetical protein H8D45_24020 [Bacteroidetes bacterium]|nr:hypothetical protein [Bacteroidota bacterium]MBL7102825.1 hypothetical protein [Bacteroidales bacterium]
MKKKLLFLIICSIQLFIGNAQEEEDKYISRSEFQNGISEINRQNYLLKIRLNDEANKITELEASFGNLQEKIDSLNYFLIVTNETNKRLADSLSLVLSSFNILKENTKSSVDEIDQAVTRRTLYWIIALIVLITLAIVFIFYIQGRLRTTSKKLFSEINRSKDILNSTIEQTNKSLSDKLDQTRNTLTEQNNQTKKIVMLNEFMHTLPLSYYKGKNENQFNKNLKKSLDIKKRAATSDTPRDIDHFLSIKMANEIHDIKNKINSIPGNTKSFDKLKEIYQKIERIFNESGYELIELEGKPFTEDMQLSSGSDKADVLENGEQIISRVIKPQVNYKGKKIQSATVEVSAAKEKA